MIADARTCSNCSRPIRGRTDKKFCDDICRNRHNNRVNKEGSIYIRLINSHLRRNRRIMEKILPVGRNSIKVPRKKLMGKGFRFTYFTNTFLNSKGKLFHFCYEFGYLSVEKNEVMVVRKTRTVEEEV